MEAAFNFIHDIACIRIKHFSKILPGNAIIEKPVLAGHNLVVFNPKKVMEIIAYHPHILIRRCLAMDIPVYKFMVAKDNANGFPSGGNLG